eukprot:NODE_6004_length_1713_cov_4.980454.p1 GENE.NODE_6004_length_1713_cov_4.980454~~NODE_6004_length_1713_cov_4.980454.p1  ORF type:complete len:315 (-),score=100.02 NODE_6004_length_1713_cov_4.980454:767-1672(-)
MVAPVPLKKAMARVVSVLRSLRILRVSVVVVPLLSMVAMLATVARCYMLWQRRPDAQPGVIFPAISALGLDVATKLIYQVGFAACGVMLSMSILLFEVLVAPHLVAGGENAPTELTPEEKSSLNRCLLCGHVAAAGIALQGIFTLEHVISLRCFVHWGGALFFICGAMQHGQAATNLYSLLEMRNAALLQERCVQRALKVRRFIVAYSSAVIFIAPLVMQFMPLAVPVGSEVDGVHKPKPGEPSPRLANIMGIVQWGLILEHALFFCTYVMDMWAAAGRPPLPPAADSAAPAAKSAKAKHS